MADSAAGARTPAGVPQREGTVFDRGYRRYQGPRAGRRQAVRSLLVYSIKRGVGIKRRWTAKVVPAILYALALLPALVIVGVRGFLGIPVLGFDYGSLYQSLSLILPVFAAAAAPEMLCDDRRQRVLQLYFSRVMTRGDYLLAKFGALSLLMGSIAVLPGLILFLGNTFLSDQPFRYAFDHAADLGRIAAAGTLIAAFYAAIGLTVAAYVDRKGIASAVVIGIVVVGSAVAGALFEAGSGAWREYVPLFSPLTVPEGVTAWAFGSAPSPDSLAAGSELGYAWYLLPVLAAVLACGGIIYRRYLHDD